MEQFGNVTQMNDLPKRSIVIYLNNAATSWPKAPGLGQILADAFEQLPLHPGRVGHVVRDQAWECRNLIADMLSVSQPEQIVLRENSTHALNLALLGFPFRRGDVILTTAQEHNAVLRPLYRLSRLRRAHIRFIPTDREGRVDMEKYRQALQGDSPRMVVVNHASNVTGAVQPVKELFGLAKEHGATTLLDASQSLGLEDVHAQDLQADMVAFTGHKYLLGPVGTGGLYVRPEIELEPVLMGGTGVRSDLREMPSEMPLRLEPGTPNLPAFVGLAHAIRWHKENPIEQRRLYRLSARLEQGLGEAGANVVTVSGRRTPVVSFTLPGWDVEEIGYVLQKEFGILCRCGLHCAPLIHAYLGTAPKGTVRFSLSRFTTDEEVEQAINAVRRLVL
jgi:cysteine desulfurase family protein